MTWKAILKNESCIMWWKKLFNMIVRLDEPEDLLYGKIEDDMHDFSVNNEEVACEWKKIALNDMNYMPQESDVMGKRVLLTNAYENKHSVPVSEPHVSLFFSVFQDNDVSQKQSEYPLSHRHYRVGLLCMDGEGKEEIDCQANIASEQDAKKLLRAVCDYIGADYDKMKKGLIR
tara:strand:+ start:34 stop:555 length:522 start_codon:yes stop_codon:yes gene_type:complete